MKNKEKFAKEIVDAVTSGGYGFCFDKSSGEIRRCDELSSCDECLFCEPHSVDECDKAKKEWAESEYIEKPVINKTDRTFLEYLREEYKFVARDKNGKLFVCEAQPRKWEKYWYLSHGRCLSLNRYFTVDFPMVKWSDEEPWLIEDLKKLEVVEEYEYLEQKARIIPDPFEAGEGEEWEATGNIFDNPELIGETKDGESR